MPAKRSLWGKGRAARFDWSRIRLSIFASRRLLDTVVKRLEEVDEKRRRDPTLKINSAKLQLLNVYLYSTRD